jgi:hypothetical protein
LLKNNQEQLQNSYELVKMVENRLKKIGDGTFLCKRKNNRREREVGKKKVAKTERRNREKTERRKSYPHFPSCEEERGGKREKGYPVPEKEV